MHPGSRAGLEESEAAHRRILVVDDSQTIHEDFRKILGTRVRSAALERLEAELFNEPTPAEATTRFDVESAFQGEEGIALVQAAVRAQRPYSVAFVDIRMQPGLDGVETVARLWEEDPDLQVVLCSAYTDYSWEEVAHRLGISQRLLMVRKPFDAVQVRQMAHALSEQGEQQRRSHQQVAHLSRTVEERTRELGATNARLRCEVEKRTRLEERLAQAERLEALGRLAAGLAHEISNPLSFILCNLCFVRSELEALASGQQPSDLGELREACRDACLGAERLNHLVQGVKHFARLDEGRRVRVEVIEALEEAISIAELSQRIHLVRDFHEVPAVWASAHGLGQVFLNLIINAGQALCSSDISRPTLRISTRLQADGWVAVELRDNGPGIRPEHLGRIFEPFFTTKPVGEGTGLGLSICHGIVAAHGGDLLAESPPGQGATFRVLLPRAPREALASTRVTSMGDPSPMHHAS